MKRNENDKSWFFWVKIEQIVFERVSLAVIELVAQRGGGQFKEPQVVRDGSLCKLAALRGDPFVAGIGLRWPQKFHILPGRTRLDAFFVY